MFTDLRILATAGLLLAATMASAASEAPETRAADNKPSVPACAVQLFDGDNFTDDSILVNGPGEFADLSKLPGAKKNWNDEADSFKAGANTKVIFYTRKNFEGKSKTYEKGARDADMDEPSSMKIICE